MMMPRISARLFDVPLMVHPGKAAAIMAGLGGRFTGSPVSIAGAQPVAHVAFQGERLGIVGDQLGRSYDAMKIKTYDVVQGCALIPIEGTLVHKGGWLGSDSGETSYQGLQAQVMRAMNDDAVKGVAFEIDSYGGEVAGAFETADMIFALSQAKPTMAILTDFAFSAGYLMASACRQVVVPERGGAGSIGVISMHADYSKALDEEGIKVTIIAAGAHKADANPYEPLPADVREHLQAEAESSRMAFAGRVGTYRAGRFSTEQALATEAQCYRGAEAVTAGLCDGVGHPSQAFRLFLSELNRA